VDVMGRKRVPNPAARMIAFMGQDQYYQGNPGERIATSLVPIP